MYMFLTNFHCNRKMLLARLTGTSAFSFFIKKKRYFILQSHFCIDMYIVVPDSDGLSVIVGNFIEYDSGIIFLVPCSFH